MQKVSIAPGEHPPVKPKYHRCSPFENTVVHFEPYCRRSGFDDSVWAMTTISTAKMIIGGGGGGRILGGGGGRAGGGGGGRCGGGGGGR
jgi:hypothetical protein